MRTLGTCLALALIAPACDSPTEPDFQDDGKEAGNSSCVETVTVLSDLEAATALGFSPAELIALAEGSRSAAMSWGEGVSESIATVKFGPESGEGTLTAGIAYKGGEARHIASEPKDTGELSNPEWGDCVDRVEVDVEVTLDSAGGALAEKFTAPLRASSPRVAFVEAALALDQLAGTFALTEKSDDVEVGPLNLELGVFAGGLFGGLSSVVEVGFEDSVAATFMNVATWPPGASQCEYGELVLGPDDALANFSAADVHAMIAEATDMQIAWNGGAPAGFTVSLAENDASVPVCATYEGESIGALRFSVEATVESDDGRWLGSFPVEVYGAPEADGSLASARLQIPAPYANSVPVDDFVTIYGLQGVKVTGFDRLILDFAGEFVLAPDGPVVTGRVELLGVVSHACPPDANGCPGDDYTDLEAGVWGNDL